MARSTTAGADSEMQATTIKTNDIKRFELTQVWSNPDAEVDIVLVHGLNGHPAKTWTAKNGVFWPSELLPSTLKDAKARVLVYGYNADVYAFGGGDKSPSSDMIYQHAQTLVNTLSMERQSEDMQENPIIWVAHSLGGILVKRALEYSNDLTSKSADPSRSIFVATYGIIFLGTPHIGSDQAKMGLILQGMADTLIPKTIFHTESQLVKTLKSNNETLQNINVHFLDIYQRFQIDFVHENMKTIMGGFKEFVVDQTSASPQLPDVRYYGIEANHSGMCKFESKNAPGYLNVSTTIKTWVATAPPVISQRFILEHRARRQVKEDNAREILGIPVEIGGGVSHASSANMTPGRLSAGGRPDSSQHSQAQRPIGRIEAPQSSRHYEYETAEIEEMNEDMINLSHSGIISTSLIHSVASIEPENNRDIHFIKPHGFRPNSLFVGRKLELAEMHKMLFDKKRRAEGTSAVLLQSLPGGGKTHLARQYIYQHLDKFPGGIFWVRAKSQEQLAAGFWEIARKVALKPSVAGTDGAAPKDPGQFITIVHEWFCANQEWLLVLDGIHFDHSEELRRFIPDNKNTSLIYTSTERNVGGDHHFMNPQVIKLPLLSAREAQELFLLELGKKDPTTEDKKNSMDLVQRMGFLPLVIHAVATNLKATEEPLHRFAKTYATGPRLRHLDTFKSIVDQLTAARAVEALNLMNIMCFFSQHIPVEMLVLGLKVLDVVVKAGGSVNDRSLNNTFKILNRYALIDRSNTDDTIASSQSSKGSREFLGDNVDIVRLHSVVQDFFVDYLKEAEELGQWLSRAIAVFSESYEKANRRIYSKNRSDYVGDYRSYEIHGKRLLQHATRNEKKYPSLKEARQSLETSLEDIKEEIDRRTRQSSDDITHGRSEGVQPSIFDRTSSSSDTAPETPSPYDKSSSRVSTWLPENIKGHHESPVSIQGENSFHGSDSTGRIAFPPMPPYEDHGYDSDRDDGLSMTIQPSKRNSQPDDSLESGWQVVRKRRSVERHRTVDFLNQRRYRDSAGAWRAANVSDPRVSLETAQGVINRTGISRPPSRGRMSGQSQAVVSLSHINTTSPPPIRGGGAVQDRRSSQRPSRLSDAASLPYARSRAEEVPDEAIVGQPQQRSSSRPSPRPVLAVPVKNPQLQASHPLDENVPPSRSSNDDNPKPSRGLAIQTPYPNSSSLLYQLSGRYSYEDMRQDYLRQANPARPSPLPAGNKAAPSTSLDRDLSQESPSDNSKSSLPSINLTNPTPRYGEFVSGYTSEPMSRYPSNYSDPLNRTLGRSPSVTETEPTPELPTFSPRIGPTSYQVYENLRDWDFRGRQTGGAIQKTPQLGFSRAALIERVDEWAVPPQQRLGSENVQPIKRTFNPTAPVFSPRAQSQPPQPCNDPRLPMWSSVPEIPKSPNFDVSDAPSMERSGSGGVRIGSSLIAFGDFPEPVDYILARERVERQRADRKAFEEGLFRERYAKERERERQREREMSDSGLVTGRGGGGVERGRGRERGMSIPNRP